MSQEPSEEKAFEATQRKLRKAREKGQVSQSKDVLIALGSIGALGYLWLARDVLGAGMDKLFDATFQAVDMGFPVALGLLLEVGATVLAEALLPLVILIIGVAILGSFAMTGGPIFAMEPIMPSASKVNPAEGFKRIYSVKAFVTFLLNLVKVSALLVAVFLALRGGIEALIFGAQGTDRGMGAFWGVTLRLCAMMAGIMAVAAILDLLMQKHLFLREMRMTRTEVKQENKDQEGEPQMRGRRKQIARRAIEFPSGLRLATFAITDGSKVVVALRYVDGETPVPVVVARAKNDGVAGLLSRAPDEMKVIDDPVATPLAKVEPGDYAPPDLVPRLAAAMRNQGVL